MPECATRGMCCPAGYGQFHSGGFTDLLEGARPDAGQVLIEGVKCGRRERCVAVIRELPTQTMIFPGLGYLDNLCFTMDHRVRGVWLLGADRTLSEKRDRSGDLST